MKLLYQISMIAITTSSACSSIAGIPRALDDGPSRDTSPVQTDATAYVLGGIGGDHVAYARATYVNRTATPVYYARCGIGADEPMFSYRRTGADSTRRLFSDWGWACVGGVPTGTIKPGDSVTVRVRLGSGPQPNMQPPLHLEDLVGTMRIEMTLCAEYSADSDYCKPLPQTQRQSNAFDVRM